MHEVEVREFKESDTLPLVEIASECFSDEISHGMPEFTEDYFIERDEKENKVIFVAELDSGVAGYVYFTESNSLPLNLDHIAVKPSCRRKGVATALMNKVIEFAEKEDYVKIRSFTRPWNKKMQALFKKLGFEKEAYLKKEYLGKDLIRFAFFL